MNKIKIFSDSSIDLSKDLLEENPVNIIPMNIIMGEDSYIDKVDVNAIDVINYGEMHKKTPQTASPTYERFEQALSTLEEDEIALLILISDKASSGTHLVAKACIEDLRLQDRAFIINTGSVSAGVGLIVYKAHQLMKEIDDINLLITKLNKFVRSMSSTFVIDKLDYLYYGGRCSSLSLMFTKGLKIRPQIEMVNGEMKVTKKYRGSLLKVHDKYISELKDDLENIDPDILIVANTPTEEDLRNNFRLKLEELDYFNRIEFADSSSTITSHAGPNTFGMFYIKKERSLEKA